MWMICEWFCFFFKQKTAYEMRISDWSSDVCSSDLVWQRLRGWRALAQVNNTAVGLWYIGAALLFMVLAGILALIMRAQLAVPGNNLVDHDLYNQQTGSASCRERVCQSV